MGRFVSATGQNLLATYEQFSCPPTGSFSCPLTKGHAAAACHPHRHHSDQAAPSSTVRLRQDRRRRSYTSSRTNSASRRARRRLKIEPVSNPRSERGQSSDAVDSCERECPNLWPVAGRGVALNGHRCRIIDFARAL